jgi:hypothetical protein
LSHLSRFEDFQVGPEAQQAPTGGARVVEAQDQPVPAVLRVGRGTGGGRRVAEDLGQGGERGGGEADRHRQLVQARLELRGPTCPELREVEAGRPVEGVPEWLAPGDP